MAKQGSGDAVKNLVVKLSMQDAGGMAKFQKLVGSFEKGELAAGKFSRTAKKLGGDFGKLAKDFTTFKTSPQVFENLDRSAKKVAQSTGVIAAELTKVSSKTKDVQAESPKSTLQDPKNLNT